MVKYNMVLNTLWKKESWNFIQSMNSCEALTKVLWRKDTVRYWAYKQAQPSAIIIWSNIVRYCINYSRHSGRRAIRCWIHKRHPIPRPNGWAMGWLLWIFFGKINWIITALHCIWLQPTLFSTVNIAMLMEHACKFDSNTFHLCLHYISLQVHRCSFDAFYCKNFCCPHSATQHTYVVHHSCLIVLCIIHQYICWILYILPRRVFNYTWWAPEIKFCDFSFLQIKTAYWFRDSE